MKNTSAVRYVEIQGCPKEEERNEKEDAVPAEREEEEVEGGKGAAKEESKGKSGQGQAKSGRNKGRRRAPTIFWKVQWRFGSGSRAEEGASGTIIDQSVDERCALGLALWEHLRRRPGNARVGAELRSFLGVGADKQGAEGRGKTGDGGGSGGGGSGGGGGDGQAGHALGKLRAFMQVPHRPANAPCFYELSLRLEDGDGGDGKGDSAGAAAGQEEDGNGIALGTCHPQSLRSQLRGLEMIEHPVLHVVASGKAGAFVCKE